MDRVRAFILSTWRNRQVRFHTSQAGSTNFPAQNLCLFSIWHSLSEVANIYEETCCTSHDVLRDDDTEAKFDVLNAQAMKMKMNLINFTFSHANLFLTSFNNFVFQKTFQTLEFLRAMPRNFFLEIAQKEIKERVEVCALEEETRCHAIFYSIGNICY